MAIESIRLVYAPDFWEQLDDLGEPYLDKAGDIVLDGMERRIPRSEERSHGRPAGYAASRLQRLGSGHDAEGRYLDVGTDATSPDGYPYPIGLEHGTKAHEIESKGKWPLRDRHGRVFGRKVFHPGTKPQPWARPSANDLNGRRL